MGRGRIGALRGRAGRTGRAGPAIRFGDGRAGPGRAAPERRRAALAFAAAALLGCAAPAAAPRADPTPRARAEARAALVAGLELYEAGEYAAAAPRFALAARHARAARAPVPLREATAAECASWLLARHLEPFSACTQRLEQLRDAATAIPPDPGLNTLLALGAVAGGRPLPPLRLPAEVRPVIRDAAREGP